MKVNVDGKNLAEYIYNYLKLKKMVRAGRDKKERVYLGNKLIYGASPPIYKHGTITDDFNRDNGEIGSSSEGWSWVETRGDIDIVSNEAVCQTAGNAEMYANSDLGSDDMYAQADCTCGALAAVSLSVRGEGGGQYDHYIGESNYFITAWVIWKRIDLGYTNLAQTTSGWALPSGNTLYTEVDGTSLVFKQDGVTKVSDTDSAITTGVYAGCNAYNTSAKYDNFEASALAVGGWSNIAKVGSVAAASMAKINGVAVADIAKLNGTAV